MTPEVIARLRRAIDNRRMIGVPLNGRLINRPLTIDVNIDDLQALIDGHEHYRLEFFHHSGGSGMDCDCVELEDKFARGEIG